MLMHVEMCLLTIFALNKAMAIFSIPSVVFLSCDHYHRFKDTGCKSPPILSRLGVWLTCQWFTVSLHNLRCPIWMTKERHFTEMHGQS